MLGCDGRRTHDLPRGARVIVRRSPVPVRLAHCTPADFLRTLVRKFRVAGQRWRGPGRLDDHDA